MVGRSYSPWYLPVGLNYRGIGERVSPERKSLEQELSDGLRYPWGISSTGSLDAPGSSSLKRI
jgi:hypothetical protein